MSDDLNLNNDTDALEEEEHTDAEPDFSATRTMAPSHDHEPIDEDELSEDLIDGTDTHSSISALGSEEEEEAAEAENYFLNGYDDDAPYSEFDEDGQPLD